MAHRNSLHTKACHKFQGEGEGLHTVPACGGSLAEANRAYTVSFLAPVSKPSAKADVERKAKADMAAHLDPINIPLQGRDIHLVEFKLYLETNSFPTLEVATAQHAITIPSA
eukprot:931785-Pelagomonas_calceolata.AAC.11